MKATVYIELDSKEIRDLGYPIMVESWGHKNFGRGRREYLARYSEQERKKLGEWHSKFYRWYLVKGPPQTLRIKPETFRFLQEAIDFFASI